jgi:hypothetical protein
MGRRQTNPDPRTMAFLTLRAISAAERGRVLSNNRETQAEASAATTIMRVALVKFRPNIGKLLARNADAGVDQGYDGFILLET